MVSTGVPILIFAYTYSSGTLDDTKYISFLNNSVIRIIIGSAFYSTSIYTSLLFIEYNNISKGILTVFIVALFFVSGFFIVVLLRQTIKIVMKDPITLHTSIAKVAVRKITMLDSRRKYVRDTLDDILSTESLKTHDNIYHITAKDLKVESGEYITDINKKKLYSEFGDVNNIAINFSKTIGDRIDDLEETVIKFTNESQHMYDEEIVSVLKKSLKTKKYDLYFGFDPFSQEYEPIHNLISLSEKLSIQAIEAHNNAKLYESINVYVSIIHELEDNTTELEPTLVDEQIIQPILNSLFRIGRFSINNIDDRERKYTQSTGDISQILTKIIIENIYRILIKTGQKNDENRLYMDLKELLKEYEQISDGQSSILKEFIQEKIGILERNETRQAPKYNHRNYVLGCYNGPEYRTSK
jgi:hypothetical protein